MNSNYSKIMCEFCNQWKQMNYHNYNVHKFDFPGKVANVDVSDYPEILPHYSYEPYLQFSPLFQITS